MTLIARDHESRKSASLVVFQVVFYMSCNILGSNAPSQENICVDTKLLQCFGRRGGDTLFHKDFFSRLFFSGCSMGLKTP